MNVLMLCDRESARGKNHKNALENALTDAGHKVDALVINREEIKPCMGCFGCWVKTPGRCVITDDEMNEISGKQMTSDAVIILTEIIYGGFSADIKSYLDRAIQNIGADFEVYKGEMRHKKRYENFPFFIAVGYGDAGEPERQTFTRLIQRNALNMRPEKFLALTVSNDETHKRAIRSVLKMLEVKA